MMQKKMAKLILLIIVLLVVCGAGGYITATADNNASLYITKQPTAATVYAGTPVTLSVSATGSGTIKYQWYSNTKNSTAGGVSISGGTGSSYSPSTSAAGTTYYYCTLYTSGATVASVTSGTAAVAVKPLPKITAQPSSQTAYVGDTVTLSVQASGSGTLTYQWYSIADSSTNGALAITNATGSRYTVPTAAVGTTYYYCVVTNTDSAITGTKTASVTSSMAKVIVNAVSTTTPTITAQPSSLCVYAGSTVKLQISAVASGTLSYQWYKNTTNSTSNGTPITGGTNPVCMVATDALGTAYYFCVVTNTTDTGAYSSTSNIAACAVKASTVITSQPTGTLCFIGDTVTLSIAATGSSKLSYQWYSNTATSTLGGSAISGATSTSYTPPTTLSSITYYYCVVTNTDSAITGTKTSVVTSSVVSVSVIVEAATAPAIKTQPVSQTVYTGSTVKLTVTATGSGTLKYQWYSNQDSSAETGTAVTGATANTYTVPTATAGATYYYCVVSNTVATAAGTETLSTATSVASVARKPLPAITTQPAGSTIFAGDTLTLTVAATGSGTLSYQWYSNTTSSTSGGVKMPGATAASYTPSTKKAGTAYYYCVVTNTDSMITGTKTASVASSIAQVVVRSRDVTAPSITKKPTNATILIGASASLSIQATGSGTLSYQWYSNTKNSTTGAEAISGATDETYTFTPTAAGIAYYYCVVTNTDDTLPGNKTATAKSGIVSVTVKALAPTMKQQPAAAVVVYKGTSLALSISASGSGTLTYQWFKSAENNTSGTAIAAATSTKYVVPTTEPCTMFYYCVVTNTVKTASETKTGTVTSAVSTVVVKPLPAITAQPAGATVYVGDSATLSIAATGSGTLSYQWYSNTKNSASGCVKLPGATGATYSPSTKKAGTIYYICVVTNTDSAVTGTKTASVASSVAQVVVKPVNAAAPAITKNPVNVTITIGNPAVLSIGATGSGTLSYQWYSNTKSSTAGATAISGATGETYSITPEAAGTTYYYCVVTNTDSTAPGTKTATTVSTIVKITAKA